MQHATMPNIKQHPQALLVSKFIVLLMIIPTPLPLKKRKTEWKKKRKQKKSTNTGIHSCMCAAKLISDYWKSYITCSQSNRKFLLKIINLRKCCISFQALYLCCCCETPESKDIWFWTKFWSLGTRNFSFLITLLNYYLV
jgi:hypothetical protein